MTAAQAGVSRPERDLVGSGWRPIRDVGLVAFDHLLDHLERLVGGSWRIDAHGPIEPDAIAVELDEGLHLIGVGVAPGVQHLAWGIVDACAPLARHALQVGRQASQAQAEASIDPLTGLVNRRGWQHGLVREEARCARDELAAVVAIIDVDELKAVNDTYGHLCGDLIIVLAAEALRSVCRPQDVIARLGGDEFGVLITGEPRSREHRIANRLRDALIDMGVAASIGTAEAAGRPFTEAVTAADRAMYRSKSVRQRARQRRLGGVPALAHGIVREQEPEAVAATPAGDTRRRSGRR